MISIEFINPPRGCGTKKKDSFYAEASSSPFGTLRLWTHVLDDGGIKEEMPLWYAPAREVVRFNPLASLVGCERYDLGDEIAFEDDRAELYVSLFRRVPSNGLLDHVGANHYSARSFADEVREFGVSRRVTKQFAKTLAEYIHKHGPAPVFFAHSRIPVVGERLEETMEIVAACIGEVSYNTYRYGPTWFHKDFGLFSTQSRPGYNGHDSYMLPVLSVIHELDKNWKRRKDNPAFRNAKSFFGEMEFAERPFGATWFTKISYTLPDDGRVPDEVQDMAGVRYLDLAANDGQGAVVGYSSGGLE